MKKFLMIISLAFFSISIAQASILNGSFENGLNNWTGPSVSVVTSYTTDNATTMTATDGQHFAILPGGNPVTKLTSDSFYVNAGETISFDWFFDAKDYLPFNDFASYALELVVDEIVVSANILSSVAQTGDYGLTGWNTFAMLAGFSGNVELRFYSKNVGDNLLPSVLGIDNIRAAVVAPVPLGSSMMFMTIGLGLVGFTAISRRKNVMS